MKPTVGGVTGVSVPCNNVSDPGATSMFTSSSDNRHEGIIAPFLIQLDRND